MPVTITSSGADENVLAQIRTDGAIADAYNGNTHKAIEDAATEAGVSLTQGCDLNMLELLAAGIVLLGLVVIFGAAILTGNVVSFDGTMSVIAISNVDGAGESGKKYVCIRFNDAPNAAAYVVVSGDPTVAPADSISINMASGGGNWTISTSEGGVPASAAYPMPALLAGDELIVYRDSATGAWGMVLPDGTDTGDISGTYGGVWVGAAFAGLGGEITGDIEFMPSGHALSEPATYTTFEAGA